MLRLYCRLFPELRQFTRSERREAWRRAKLAAKSSILFTVAFILMLPVIPTANSLLARLHLPPLLAALTQLGGLLLFAALTIALYSLWSRPVRQSLRRQLVDRGIPLCIRCGYDLAGSSSIRCPECGVALSPRQRGNHTAPE